MAIVLIAQGAGRPIVRSVLVAGRAVGAERPERGFAPGDGGGDGVRTAPECLAGGHAAGMDGADAADPVAGD